ncbi:MAG: cell division protein FtsA [Patescibacteria group bacterium]|nr:cell division protein FtsA [Patescibacteria group bacterium]
MPRDRILAGIDVGTSKITTTITSRSEEGVLRVMGVASTSSKGIRKGQVVDIEEATQSVVESIEAAERMAGYSVSQAFVSIGGAHVSSQNSHGVVAVAEPEKEITIHDIDRVVDAAKAVSLPSSREIIHVLPRGFTVDGQEGIKDPVGMTGVRLEVDTHLITVGATARRNLEKCITEVGVDVLGFVFGGLASSEAVLTETEKELGVILIDMGAGTTDVCIYVEGALSYSSVLPIGAKNITNDIAIGLRVSLESAEKIKLFLSKKIKKPTLPSAIGEKEENKKPSSDEIDFSSLQLPEDIKNVPKRTLIDGIIKPRLNEIFTMIGLEIKKSGFVGLTPSGIVITGGGAETINIIEAAKRNLAMPVRLGLPGEKITGLIDEILAPAFATSIGLLLYGSKFDSSTDTSSFSFKGISKMVQKVPLKGVAGKFADLIKSFLP